MQSKIKYDLDYIKYWFTDKEDKQRNKLGQTDKLNILIYLNV